MPTNAGTLGRPTAASVSDEQLVAPESTTSSKRSYGQILKSSAMVGGSSLLNTAIGIGRTKAMAVMLGPAGFGLMGLYWSICDLAVTIAGMGINMSGVRQTAEANSTGDAERIARTSTVLRRTALGLGVIGAVLIAALSGPISTLTFGTEAYATAVAVLAFAVLFRLLADGRVAVIHGLRRIADLATMGPIGALLGALAGVALVYFLGERGVALAVVANAAMGLLVVWWFGRSLPTSREPIPTREVAREVSTLLQLGAAFMASNLLTISATYAIRILVLRYESLETAGLYQAALTLGSLYIGVLLQAMGTDFYPRLVGAAQDDAECNRLVNEQTQVSLLLAGPGVAATLSLAPYLIVLFYSAKFAEAATAMQWLCAGMSLRVISWPMGMVMVAKNSRRLFFWSELAWTTLSVALAWLLVRNLGLEGVGMAFFATSVFHLAMTYLIVRRLSGFRWSAANLKTGMLFISTLAAVFVGYFVLPGPWAAAFGAVVVLASGAYALRALLLLFSEGQLPPALRVLLSRLRPAI